MTQHFERGFGIGLVLLNTDVYLDVFSLGNHKTLQIWNDGLKGMLTRTENWRLKRNRKQPNTKLNWYLYIIYPKRYGIHVVKIRQWQVLKNPKNKVSEVFGPKKTSILPSNSFLCCACLLSVSVGIIRAENETTFGRNFGQNCSLFPSLLLCTFFGFFEESLKFLSL